jgi:hypothetical protein
MCGEERVSSGDVERVPRNALEDVVSDLAEKRV